MTEEIDIIVVRREENGISDFYIVSVPKDTPQNIKTNILHDVYDIHNQLTDLCPEAKIIGKNTL